MLKGRQGVGYIHAPELRVVDENMEDVPADGKTLGEVVMRGNNVMKGYYRDEKATAEAFRGGWFHSGDLAVVHPDGYIELKDRKKDIIISGGVNISTIEVERALYQHPDILEAAVVGVPDPYWGEVPKAYVTLRPGARLKEEEVIAFTRDRLPSNVRRRYPSVRCRRIQRVKCKSLSCGNGHWLKTGPAHRAGGMR